MLPEMKKNKTYTIKLCQDKKSGGIGAALCGCTAGDGLKGSYKHIAEHCYALEDFSRAKNFVAYMS